MDFLKVRLFITNLTYDLDTVQCLLDYGRLKETVPMMNRILDNMDSFRSENSGNGLRNIFPEVFWNNRLPAKTSFSEMRQRIRKYSQEATTLSDEDLERIGYRAFVRNVFIWSDENIFRLRHEAQSPLQRKIEKGILYLLGIAAVLTLVFVVGWMLLSRDWGLHGSFYQGRNFEKHLFSAYKKTINFSSPKEMNAGLPQDNFSVRWKGKLLIPQDGTYTIRVTADDGVRVLIDNKLLMSDWTNHSQRDSVGKIFLSKGAHQITLEYYQVDGPAVLRLSWAMDGGKMEMIPAKYLRP